MTMLSTLDHLQMKRSALIEEVRRLGPQTSGQARREPSKPGVTLARARLCDATTACLKAEVRAFQQARKSRRPAGSGPDLFHTLEDR